MTFSPGRIRAIRDARRALARFLLAIPLLAVIPLAVRFRWGGPAHPGFDSVCVMVLVWIPAMAAVLAMWPSFPIGLGLGPPRALGIATFALAILGPLAVAAISYGIAWAANLAPFRIPHVPEWLGLGTWGQMVHWIAFHLRRGLLTWLAMALGEEIGWRGFLVVQLKRADLPLPLLTCGLIWSAWHWPGLLTGNYPQGPDRVISVLVFTVTLTAFSYSLAALRIASGSVWPPTLAHALWNSFFFDSFEGATRASTPWTRESGILTAVAALVVALLTLALLSTAVRLGGPGGASRRAGS